MSDLVQKIADSVREEQRKAAAAGQLDDIEGAIRQVIASQPQERGEAVAWQRFHYGQWVECTKEFYDQCVMLNATGTKSVYKVRALYTHPTPDAGRVAEPDRLAHRYNRELVSRLQSFLDRLANDDYAGTKFEADGDALRDAMVFVRDAERALLNWQYEYEELEKGHRHYKSKADGLEAQLAESREREGRMREALAERLKNAEQAAFEAWFYKECPSGDAAAVQDKWLESDARADALDGWTTADAALAAEKEQK